jgi:hypothetical protein
MMALLGKEWNVPLATPHGKTFIIWLDMTIWKQSNG